jgi:hypothetical protein
MMNQKIPMRIFIMIVKSVIYIAIFDEEHEKN